MKSILVAFLIPALYMAHEAVKIGSQRPQQMQRYTLSGVTGAAILMVPTAMLAFIAGKSQGRGR